MDIARIDDLETIQISILKSYILALQQETHVLQDQPNLLWQQDYQINQQKLGKEMTCPTPDCGLQLILNPFVIEMD